MARYRYASYRSRKGRFYRRIYLAAGVVIIILVIFFIFTGEGKDQSGRQAGEATGTEPAAETKPGQEALVVEPEVSSWQEDMASGQWQPGPDSDFVGVVPSENVEMNPEAEKLISRAEEFIRQGKIIAARDILNDALLTPLAPQQRQEIKKKLGGLADKWLFSRDVFPGDVLCGQYTVRPGERLSQVAGQYKVPYQILMLINNIPRPEAFQAGDTIKVINGPFHVKVSLSTFTMDLYLQKTYVRSFRIGHGRPGRETPTGRWRVKEGGKLKKPTWTDPDTGRTYLPDDPDYPLGSRWIGLEGLEGKAKGRTGFAIHGTKRPDEIGTRNSKGCIRLHNGDVILVYNLLAPVFSEVIVQE